MSGVITLPPPIHRGFVAIRASGELGYHQVSSFIFYKVGLHLGWIKRAVARDMVKAAALSPKAPASGLLALPDKAKLRNTLDQDALQKLFQEADDICAGKYHLFGGPAIPFQFNQPEELQDWSGYEKHAWLEGIGDIKLVWEPGRFGWAVVLARAFYLNQDERYPAAFWRWTEEFFTANPAGFGPHWVSAQEVALRMICLVFAWQVFSGNSQSTPERAVYLARWIAVHAGRIPPTLSYARAQNNNHLLSEAAGLFTAGVALPEHPQAGLWRRSGWHLLNQALQEQIATDGTYVQHSTNYHRLMLQIALWSNALANHQGDTFPKETLQRLTAASKWLNSLCDPKTGCTPNLGANDGAYILPLSTCVFKDYRPVIQAAALAFSGAGVCNPGPWNEMALWFGQELPVTDSNQPISRQISEHLTVLHMPQDHSWAYLRAARFNNRPGHADQLHFDLWWQGLNLAMDAGTFSYNAAPPWDNSLSAAFVHNTVILNGLDQMERVGRFLYLQRAQAEVTEKQSDNHSQHLSARHDGYRTLNAIHTRIIVHMPNRWTIRDRIISNQGKTCQVYSARLHWLMPDFPWNLETEQEKVRITLNTPNGIVALLVTAITNPGQTIVPLLVYAGERVAGEGEIQPTWGWFSPTYNVRQPALSLSVTLHGQAPFEFNSSWDLPDV